MPLDDFLAALDGDEVVKVNAAAPADPLQLTEQEEHFLDVYSRLSDREKEMIESYMRYLLATSEESKLSDHETQMWKDVEEIAREEMQSAAREDLNVK